jgi:hypothetical protein
LGLAVLVVIGLLVYWDWRETGEIEREEVRAKEIDEAWRTHRESCPWCSKCSRR